LATFRPAWTQNEPDHIRINNPQPSVKIIAAVENFCFVQDASSAAGARIVGRISPSGQRTSRPIDSSHDAAQLES